MLSSASTNVARWIGAAYVAAFLVVLASGIWFHRSHERSVRHSVETNLEAIASLKVGQIVQWRTSQRDEAAELASGMFLAQHIERWLALRHADDHEMILRRLRSAQKHHRWPDILLVSPSGQVQLSLSGRKDPLSPTAATTLAIALKTRQAQLTELYLDDDTVARPRMDAIAPLFSAAGKPLGALIFECDTRDSLYPLVGAWPTASASAETPMVRADGDSVLFLNDLRHRADTALRLRIPYSQSDAPAVAAVAGHEGLFVGRDYRDVPVITVLRAIPGSAWFLIAKMDEREAMAEWRVRSLLIVATVSCIMAMLLLSLLWLKKSAARQSVLYRAQRELRSRERQYRALFEGAPVGIFLATPGGTLVSANRALIAMLGYENADALLADAGGADSGLGAAISGHAIAGGPGPVSRELPLKRRNGDTFFAEVSLQALDSGAAGIRYQGVVQDVTERKRAGNELLRYRDELEVLVDQRTEELRTREQHLSMALAAANAGNWDWDQQSGEMVWSNSLAHMFGYTPSVANASYAAWAACVHPEDLPGVEAAVHDCIEGRSNEYAAEYRVTWPDGSEHWIEARGCLATARDGHVHMYGVAIDISHRKHVEALLSERVIARTAELRSERDFVDTMLNLAPMIVLVLDSEGRVIRLNQACEQLTGFASDAVAGKLWHTLLEVETTIGSWAEFVARCRDDCVGRFETTWRIPEGTTHHIEWHNACLTDASGKMKMLVGAGIEITERRHLEKEYRQRLEDLAQMHRLHTMGELAALLAHQLNQPLGAARNFAEAGLMRIARGSTDPEEMSRTLNKVVAQTDRAAQVIRDLRSFLSRQSPETEVHNIDTAVRAACALMAPLARARKIDLKLQASASLPQVLIRPTHIEQVLINLMQNAIEAIIDSSDRGGSIVVQTEYADAEGEVIVAVRDSGPGLSTETASMVFEPLYTTKTAGIGMGLSISRSIVSDHGGRIWAVPGRGGDFRMAIPTKP